MRIHKLQKNQSGFTIIELMVATAVLSVILLLVTIMIISIGNLYYKGVNQARIQDDSRNVTNQISQDLKLNSGNVIQGSGVTNLGGVAVTVNSYCIGNSVRYSYILSHEIGATGSNDFGGVAKSSHVLWRDTDNSDPGDEIGGGNCPPIDVSHSGLANRDPNGIEMISSNSRLTTLCIGATPVNASNSTCSPAAASPYSVSVGVAYGDADLLHNLNGTTGTSVIQSPTASCNGHTGEQFCATDLLNTTVVQRLSGS